MLFNMPCYRAHDLFLSLTPVPDQETRHNYIDNILRCT